jgi:hypothetical protein
VVDKLAAAFDPCVAAAHSQVHTWFVEEDEPLGINSTNPLQIGGAL